MFVRLIPHRGADHVGHVTDEVRAQMHQRTPRQTAHDPVGADALRRFVQATMEPDPIHWDSEVAGASRYGRVVATPLYPVHAFRRPAGTTDPLDRAFTDPDWDGSGQRDDTGLPPLPLGLDRHLNGGSEVEFYQLAAVGDTVSVTHEYLDATDKVGKSGELVIVRREAEYTNQDGDVLMTVRRTGIHR
jgi:acyl dehydratase